MSCSPGCRPCFLSGTNTYTGATTINSGTLRAGSSSAFGPTSQVTINGSGILDSILGDNTIDSLSGTGLVTLGTGAGGTLTVGAGLGPFINTTYSGVISGNGGLDYNTYDQTLTLTGANTYTGATTTSGQPERYNSATAGPPGRYRHPATLSSARTPPLHWTFWALLPSQMPSAARARSRSRTAP